MVDIPAVLGAVSSRDSCFQNCSLCFFLPSLGFSDIHIWILHWWLLPFSEFPSSNLILGSWGVGDEENRLYLFPLFLRLLFLRNSILLSFCLHPRFCFKEGDIHIKAGIKQCIYVEHIDIFKIYLMNGFKQLCKKLRFGDYFPLIPNWLDCKVFNSTFHIVLTFGGNNSLWSSIPIYFLRNCVAANSIWTPWRRWLLALFLLGSWAGQLFVCLFTAALSRQM